MKKALFSVLIGLLALTSRVAFAQEAPPPPQLLYIEQKEGDLILWTVSDADPTHNSINLTADVSGRVSHPSWESTGSKILYTLNGCAIWIMNVHDSSTVKISPDLLCATEGFWSKTAEQIAFLVNMGTSFELWIVNVDGTDPMLIAQDVAACCVEWTYQGELTFVSLDTSDVREQGRVATFNGGVSVVKTYRQNYPAVFVPFAGLPSGYEKTRTMYVTTQNEGYTAVYQNGLVPNVSDRDIVDTLFILQVGKLLVTIDYAGNPRWRPAR